MKILILCTKLPWPPRDGGAIATLNLAVGLADSGCQVTLLTMNTTKHYFPAQNLPETIRGKIRITTVDVDTRIRPMALLGNFFFSSYPYNAQRFISDDFSREIASCLEETEYDILQLEGPYLVWYIPLIRKYSDVKIALRAHNQEHRIWEQTSSHEKGFLRRIYLRTLARRIRKLEKNALPRIQMLVPISESDEKGFRLMDVKLPTFVCPTGLDVGMYTVVDPGRDIRLFFIGALDWGPNQEGLDWFFGEVWPAILEKWPDQTLSLAGRNPSYYFRMRKVPVNVDLRGELDDAMAFYNDHNVMIVPLLSGSGIRIKILEAMAMGKVVISTSAGAAGLKAVPGEHLFIADSAEDFMTILQQLLDQPGIMREMQNGARKFVTENFDNLAIANKLISFYKEQLAWSGK